MAILSDQQLATMQETLLSLNAEPNAPMGIEAAVSQLEAGDSGPAEDLFALLIQRRAAAGPSGLSAAAEVACDLGDLASTHDTAKATQAYLYAVQLDPEAAPAWNRLAATLAAEGKNEPANLAFRKALAFAVMHADHESSAIATCGLGELAFTASNFVDAHKWWTYAFETFAAQGLTDRCAWVQSRLLDLAPDVPVAASVEG